MILVRAGDTCHGHVKSHRSISAIKNLGSASQNVHANTTREVKQ